MARLCPECGETISLKATNCNACGWQADKIAGGLPRFHIRIGNEVVDTQCDWRSEDGSRCPLKGWMAESTNGFGPWMCGPHYWRRHGHADKKRELPDQPRTLKDFLGEQK